MAIIVGAGTGYSSTYGVAGSIDIPLVLNGALVAADPGFAVGDAKISKDGAAAA